MNPTDEQVEALRLFATGDSLAIEAGAGTGKTSTLVLLSESDLKRRGQYIAFNKALVEDGKGKFPAPVSANTAHSLAFRAYGNRFASRLRDSQRMPSHDIARRLGLDPLQVTDFDGKPKTLAAGFLAGLCSKAVRGFCQSADQTIAEWHFPFIEGLDEIGDDGKQRFDTNRYVRRELLPYARAMWDDTLLPRGWVPYQHDHYLKAWQLSDPRIDVDYVMFDEAQDANPVIAAIVAAQGSHAQLVYVGDSQQEIYSFTGAVNALANVQVDHRTYLTQSFRFGQAIADEANVILDKLNAPLRLRGNPAIDSVVEALASPNAILTRTNAAAIRNLLSCLQDATDVHLIGGAADIIAFCTAAEELMTIHHTSHPELAVFGSWMDVQMYVEQEPEGEDLRLMVRLIDEFTPRGIIDAMRAMSREDQAEVVISTAHKSKGRQWPTVQLASDFKRPKEKDNAGEQRLLYVAVTRAQNTLDIEALADEEEKALEARDNQIDAGLGTGYIGEFK